MLASIERWLNRFFFSGLGGLLGADTRIEIYETIELLMTNDVPLTLAIKELYRLESRAGTKNTAANAMFLYDCYSSRNNGKPLWFALQRWVPNQEMQIIRAGEESAKVPEALRNVIELIESKRKIMGAVISGSTYPLVLLGMVGMLLHQIATNMVPQFLKILPAEKWTGPAVGLKVVADWVNGYGTIGVIVVACSAAWVIWSMPNMDKSRFRVYLDSIPPWSIYRMLNGSTFLLNFSLMLAANVKMQTTLEIMRESASPWLKERIGAAITGVNKGSSFVEALHQSGYEFPDRRAVQYLRLLSEQNDFEEKLVNFGKRWLDKSVKGVQSASKAMLAVSISLMGSLIMLILGGVIGIQQLAQTALSTH